MLLKDQNIHYDGDKLKRHEWRQELFRKAAVGKVDKLLKVGREYAKLGNGNTPRISSVEFKDW